MTLRLEVDFAVGVKQFQGQICRLVQMTGTGILYLPLFESAGGTAWLRIGQFAGIQQIKLGEIAEFASAVFTQDRPLVILFMTVGAIHAISPPDYCSVGHR